MVPAVCLWWLAAVVVWQPLWRALHRNPPNRCGTIALKDHPNQSHGMVCRYAWATRGPGAISGGGYG